LHWVSNVNSTNFKNSHHADLTQIRGKTFLREGKGDEGEEEGVCIIFNYLIIKLAFKTSTLKS
jgi:hypothetical protein